MQDIVNREDELARLQQSAAEQPQLVVLRGRRRIGKSFLVERAFAHHRRVSFQADEQDERGHLGLLAQEAARLLPGAPPLAFGDWNTALRFFGDQARESPLVVVLDEFQWVWRAQSALPSIIQRHWDEWQRGGVPITLVLSGSALALMEKLLDHGSPLFGRANYRPLLMPLGFRDAASFAQAGIGAEQALMRFAVLGGTPQYQAWAGKVPLVTVIRGRILAKGESLYEEPLHLLREEQRIRDPGTYFAILRAIAEGATQFNEIAQRAHVDKNLTAMLGRLEELAYVERRTPVEAPAKGKRSTYRIADPFFRFWFRFVFPNRSRLELGRADEVLREIEGRLDDFMGLAFEDCCREWVGRHAPGGAVPSPETLGSWWSRDGQSEVDIAGMSGGRYDLLASCKWSRKAGTSALGDLLAAQERLGAPARNARLAIFARGFDPKLAKRAGEEGVALISADDLFSKRRP